MNNNVLFWTQIASMITFVSALFALYRVLAQQKDATIELLRETVGVLKDQLAEARRVTPDVIAQALAGRVKLLEAELERLSKDQNSEQAQIQGAEEQLRQARLQADELSKQIQAAHELLAELSCPFCGSPLVTRAYTTESVHHQGRVFDVDHEYKEFECGYAERDGKAEHDCGNNGPPAELAP